MKRGADGFIVISLKLIETTCLWLVHPAALRIVVEVNQLILLQILLLLLLRLIDAVGIHSRAWISGKEGIAYSLATGSTF